MCCACCTSLKVAATWGAGIQIGVGLLLLLRYFFKLEYLGPLEIPYLVYLGLLIFLGLILLLGIQKEIGWLVKIPAILFILVQIYGLTIRLLIPMEEKTVFQRISALFVAILMTAVYTFILIMYSRKLSPSSTPTQSSVEV